MGMIEPMIEELKAESMATRKALERVPDGAFDWKPHEKSMSLGQLASHLADSGSWVDSIVNDDELVMDPTSYVPWRGKNIAEVLETFDRNTAAVIARLTGLSDGKLLEHWALKVGDATLLDLPRVAVIRVMLLSHMIHHRAQLGLYLRLNDIPVPQSYGPTADEMDMTPAG